MEFHRTRIRSCKPNDDYTIWLQFDDGLSGTVDLRYLVDKGVFKALRDIEFFKLVRIDPTTETISWNEELDLDPYALRERILKQTRQNH